MGFETSSPNVELEEIEAGRLSPKQKEHYDVLTTLTTTNAEFETPKPINLP